MAKLLWAAPVLPAQDVKATVRFYEEKLGFRARHQDDEYGIVSRDNVEIHFWRCDDRHIAESSSCRLTVEGVDELFERAKEAQIVHPDGDLELKPWGTREFPILDPNGNLVWFLEPAKDPA